MVSGAERKFIFGCYEGVGVYRGEIAFASSRYIFYGAMLFHAPAVACIRKGSQPRDSLKLGTHSFLYWLILFFEAYTAHCCLFLEDGKDLLAGPYCGLLPVAALQIRRRALGGSLGRTEAAVAQQLNDQFHVDKKMVCSLLAAIAQV